MIKPIDALKDKMVMAATVLRHQGWIDGYGHLTAGLPNHKILRAPHMPPAKVTVSLAATGATCWRKTKAVLTRIAALSTARYLWSPTEIQPPATR